MKTCKDIMVYGSGFAWKHSAKKFPYKMYREIDLKSTAGEYLIDLDKHISKTYPGETITITEGEMATEVMKRTKSFIKHFFDIEDTNAIKPEDDHGIFVFGDGKNKKRIKIELSKEALKELEDLRKKFRDETCVKCPLYKECYDKNGKTKSDCKIRLK